MRFLPYFAVLLALTSLAGCTPLAAVGAVGTTITNAAYNSAERDLNNSGRSREEQALEVATANLNLGVEYMRQGDYETALAKLQRALQAKSDYAPAYSVLGVLYQRLRDPKAAEENFKKAIKLDPDASSYLNNYAQFLCSQDRKQEAKEAFVQAANNPFYDSPEIALTNAGICTINDDKQQARAFFLQALEKNASFSPALLELADLSYQAERYELAHEYFTRYRQRAPQTPRSLWLGIRICHELGYKDDLASYSLLLKNKFPDANEALLLEQMTL